MKTLSNGAYAVEFQGHRQRVDLGLVRAVQAVIPRTATVVDLGCGIGKLVEGLRQSENGCYQIDGVDGTPGIQKLTDGLVEEVDLTREVCFGVWDWGVCTEVGEHIPPEHEQRFLNTICKAVRTGLLLTWADIGSRGYGHVNCRTQVYVASELAKRGLFVDNELTQKARACVRPKYRQRLMVATKEGQSND